MNENFQKHSQTWVSFSYLSFGTAVLMLVIGIYLMPLDLWGKGYLTMGILMLLQTAINVTKTLRDNQEAERLQRRMEEAVAERRMAGFGRGDAN